MSTSQKLDYTRSVLRGKSDRMSTTGMRAMKIQAYQRMAAAEWLPVDGKISSLPPHWYNQTGFNDTYDAATFCGDYTEGQQHAYACAACYTIKIPADARADPPAKIEAITASLFGDRWLSDGAIISAYITETANPPAWASIVNRDAPTYLLSSPDPAPALEEATTPDWQAPLRAVIRSNDADDTRCNAVITANTPTNAGHYLHIIIRLSDYLSVYKVILKNGTIKDNAWVEGGAAIDGTTLTVQFDRPVLDNAPETIELTPKRFESTEEIRNTDYDIADMCFFRHTRSAFSFLSSDEDFWDWSFRERICHYPDSLLLRVSTGLEIGSYYTSSGFRYAGIHTEFAGTDAVVDFSSLVYGRTGVSRGGILTGIKMDNSAPLVTEGIPDGQTFRLSFYLATANYSISPGTAIPNRVHKETYVSRAFWDGSASSIKLSGLDDNYIEVPVTPVTHIDLDEPLAAETAIPLPEPIPLPSGLVILIACLSLHSLAAGYDKPTDVDTSVTWNPEGSFYLMVEQ